MERYAVLCGSGLSGTLIFRGVSVFQFLLYKLLIFFISFHQRLFPFGKMCAAGLYLSELAWNDRAKGRGCLYTSALGNSADARAEEASKRMGKEHPTVLEAGIQVRLDRKEFSEKCLQPFCSEKLPVHR